jgi:hypothetical protein
VRNGLSRIGIRFLVDRGDRVTRGLTPTPFAAEIAP